MSKIDKDSQELQSHIKQNVDLVMNGFNGAIAEFLFTYKGNDYKGYTKNAYAYASSLKPKGYKYTVVIYNKTARKSVEVGVHEGATVILDLNDV